MNFYKHHLGDYAQATAHLTFVEDAAYSRLLRKYYAEEQPIPAELKAAQRLVGARTREEKDAVETVLEEFFELQDDGWHNKRADVEIAATRDAEAERDARKENEAERQRRHRERRKELFAALREHGEVPKYDTKTEVLETMLSRVTGGEVTRDQPVTGHDSSRVTGGTRHALATANQTPDTRRQTPDKSITPHTPHENPVGVGTPAGLAAAALNRAGCRITSHDPRLLEAIGEGVTADLLLEVRDQYPDKPAGYVVAAARRIHADAGTTTPTGATHAASPQRGRLGLADQARAQHQQRAADRRDHDDRTIDGEATRVEA